MTTQMAVAVVLAWVSGALTSACFFYPLGRRHGIAAMAAHFKRIWREQNHDPIAELAARVGAKVRGASTTKIDIDQRDA